MSCRSGAGVPAKPDESADVIALVDCPFAGARPSGEYWEDIHEYYQTTGHAQQLRMMLQILGQE